MQIREHAEAHPDRPAVILHPSGKQCNFRGDGGAGQPARAPLPAGRPCRGRRRRGADGEQRAPAHGDVGGAAQRAVLRGDQHPPHRARGGVHHRQLRRQGRHRFTGHAQGVRGAGRASAERPARPADDRRRRPRRLAALPRVCCRRACHPDRRRDRRRPAAVLLGNDRASQGNSRELSHLPPAEMPTCCRVC